MNTNFPSVIFGRLATDGTLWYNEEKRKGGGKMDKKEKDGVVMRPIAHIYTGFSEKFGIPRQSGLVDGAVGRIVFAPEYRSREALRELDGFSHIWLLWHFTEAVREGFRPTVRPPRLGGNKRVGVFASRSPFRPNHIGLSAVHLIDILYDVPEGPVLLVSGVDMLDGTPIFDIKPYIPVADCHPEAREGYTKDTRTHALQVTFGEGLLVGISPEIRNTLIGVLAEDPRPGYEGDPQKEYGLTYGGYDVGFTVADGVLTVFRLQKI